MRKRRSSASILQPALSSCLRARLFGVRLSFVIDVLLIEQENDTEDAPRWHPPADEAEQLEPVDFGAPADEAMPDTFEFHEGFMEQDEADGPAAEPPRNLEQIVEDEWRELDPFAIMDPMAQIMQMQNPFGPMPM